MNAQTRFDVIPLRRGIMGRIILIQSWSQLISSIITLAVAFCIIFFATYAIAGHISRERIYFLTSFGLLGSCVSLVKARQVSLFVRIHPQGLQYWLDKIDKAVYSLGYRESESARHGTEIRHYLPTYPNFLLPKDRRGPTHSRPFVPRWSRWRENELAVSWIKDEERLRVTGAAVSIDRLLRRL